MLSHLQGLHLPGSAATAFECILQIIVNHASACDLLILRTHAESDAKIRLGSYFACAHKSWQMVSTCSYAICILADLDHFADQSLSNKG